MRSFIATMLLVFWFIWSHHIIATFGDVGTARSYGPPYLPTKCKGELPEGGYFVAVSEGLWDNGAACGRRYQMRCISGPNRPCKGDSILVEVVDLCKNAPQCSTTMFLSNKAFNSISRFPNAKINVEYGQV